MFANGVLPRRFYSRETIDVARELLGKTLIRRLHKGALLEGCIVETEGYRGKDDPASHAFRGMTERNKVMFDEVGLAYVYFIYGNHYCLNVTARDKSEEAGAVLIRALEPTAGIEYMIKNRRFDRQRAAVGEKVKASAWRELTNGPGKLTQAMEITGASNGTDMVDARSELLIRETGHRPDLEIAAARRIGIRSGGDKLWRFYVRGSEFASKTKRAYSISSATVREKRWG